MADRLSLTLTREQSATVDTGVAFALTALVAGFLFIWAVGLFAPGLAQILNAAAATL